MNGLHNFFSNQNILLYFTQNLDNRCVFLFLQNLYNGCACVVWGVRGKILTYFWLSGQMMEEWLGIMWKSISLITGNVSEH